MGKQGGHINVWHLNVIDNKISKVQEDSPVILKLLNNNKKVAFLALKPRHNHY